VRADTLALSPARHVPRLALDWVADTPDRRHRSVPGTMVFADISGFTALSERLATKGRIGAEELVETLSRVFGAIIDAAAERGGELLKFGGDALLFLFDSDDHAVQAASAAVEIRAELRRAADIVTSVGRLALSISIGLHSGDFDVFLVGGPHRELVVLGPGTSGVVAAENAAVAGEVVVSAATAARLPPASVRLRHDGELLLRWRRAPVGPGGPRPGRPGDDEAARRLLPAILFESFDGTRPDPAHRVGTIAFMKFSGTDAVLAEHGPDELAERLDVTLEIAQRAFVAEDVALLCVDCDVDGGKLFASSGVPLTSEDDEGRMLRAARAIVTENPPLALQIGINRGHVFAAEVGTPRRAAYSAMGDTTNTAARICGKSSPGSIFVHPDVLAHARTLYEADPVGPFTLKGKALPQTFYRLGDELGPRTADDPDDVPIIGRADELARAAAVVAGQAAGQGGALVVTGPVGIGKSRLVREAIAAVPAERLVHVHAEPYGASNPFRVFRDPLRQLCGVARGPQPEMSAALRATVRRLVPQHEPMLALLADILQIDVEPTDEVAALSPQYRPDRTADVLIDLLAASLPEGLVLVVEDAHWADDSSSHLVARLARDTASRPWIVCVVGRDDEGAALLDADAERGEQIELGPLAPDAVRELAIWLTEAAPLRPHQLDELVERSGGNPLFAAELVRAVQQIGSLAEMPTSLQGAVAAQVDVLDPLAKRVLSYASVLGRTFRRVVFDRVLSSEGIRVDPTTFARLTPFLEEAGPDRWQFHTALLRDVVYDGLGYNLRARLHREAGQAIEAMSSDPLAEAETLALHYARAGEHARAYPFAVAAAERSERAHATATAAAQLEAAIESARRVDGVAPSELRDLWVRLGVARDHAGLLDGAIDAFRLAARLPADDLAAAELLLRRAEVRERAGSFPLALRDATAARRRVGSSSDRGAQSLRARSQAFAATVRQRQERVPDARREARAAARAAEACGDRAALARASSVISWAALVLGDDDPVEYGVQALDLYHELGDVTGEAHMANNLGGFAYFQGDWARTIEMYTESVEAFRQAGNVTNAHLANANLGEVLVSQNRLAEAEPLLRDAVRVLGASGHLWGAAFAKMHLGRLLSARGEQARAEALLRECIDENRRMGSLDSVYEAAIHLGSCLVADGRPGEALAVIDEAHKGTSADVSIFAAAAALIRVRALAATGMRGAAVDTLRSGLETARARNLEFDLAWLLVLAAELGVEGAPGAEQPADEARRLFTKLGVRH